MPKKDPPIDLFSRADAVATEETTGNAPHEMSVSELSQNLRRMVENTFSYVRVRGELSRITIAKSGHLYTDLKDENAVLNAICWKGSLARLNLRPEEGMDVIVTGRLTTYPGRSNYQLIIETMELAGQGALLKLLEERKRKMAAEGLFDAARKRPLPFLPRLIGVITSPTGAVIRDILHRLADRCPTPVLVWPVAVQGAQAAADVVAAIEGFNAIPEGDPRRPDILIVARGGGSLEDLMPFSDEAVVRAAAQSRIPLISAVGHETDTTLIDHAADLRAPTPTAAAEKSVPVRRELLAFLADSGQRLDKGMTAQIQKRMVELRGLVRGLGQPQHMIDARQQRLDLAAQRLDHSLIQWLNRKGRGLDDLAARLKARSPVQRAGENRRHLDRLQERLSALAPRLLKEKRQALAGVSALLESLSFERVLERGYAVAFDKDGRIVSRAETAPKAMTLRFADGRLDVEKKEVREKS